jgi:hypothetical protein
LTRHIQIRLLSFSSLGESVREGEREGGRQGEREGGRGERLVLRTDSDDIESDSGIGERERESGSEGGVRSRRDSGVDVDSCIPNRLGLGLVRVGVRVRGRVRVTDRI